jgi:hypothetical protein
MVQNSPTEEAITKIVVVRIRGSWYRGEVGEVVWKEDIIKGVGVKMKDFKGAGAKMKDSGARMMGSRLIGDLIEVEGELTMETGSMSEREWELAEMKLEKIMV